VLDCVGSPRSSDTLAHPLLGHELSWLVAPSLDDCGEPGLGEKLRMMGYSHVVARQASDVGRWLMGHPPPEGLVPGLVFEDARIFEVKAEVPAAYVRDLPGFYPREYGANTTWRWMGQTGGLRLVATRESRGTWLEVELKAFARGRSVLWSRDGQTLGTIGVTTEWSRYELPLGLLAPGETTLILACQGPGLVPNDFLGNADPRPLGIALGRWSIGALNRESPR
jgi:hypothetical protein